MGVEHNKRAIVFGVSGLLLSYFLKRSDPLMGLSEVRPTK
jgi:hypothetical protein